MEDLGFGLRVEGLGFRVSGMELVWQSAVGCCMGRIFWYDRGHYSGDRQTGVPPCYLHAPPETCPTWNAVKARAN